MLLNHCMSLLIMPCKGDFSVEIERWRIKVGELPVHQNIPGLQFALKLADKDLYANIHPNVASTHSRPWADLKPG